jgi:hypothetical protein
LPVEGQNIKTIIGADLRGGRMSVRVRADELQPNHTVLIHGRKQVVIHFEHHPYRAGVGRVHVRSLEQIWAHLAWWIHCAPEDLFEVQDSDS